MNGYTVKRGDTLWGIAKTYAKYISGNTINARIDTLVKVNNIKNRNLIYVNQYIKFSSGGSGSTTGSTAKKQSMVTVSGFGLKSDDTSGRSMIVNWSPWSNSQTAGYTCRWQQYLNGKWVGDDTDINETADMYLQSTFTADGAATKVKFQVRPFYKKKSGNTETNTFWSDVVWSAKVEYDFSDNPPQKPPIPSIEVEDKTLKISIYEIKPDELDATSIKFNVVKDNTSSIYTSPAIAIKKTSGSGAVSYYVEHPYTVDYGHDYKVRACSVSAKGKESGWSDFSSNEGTKPTAPKKVAASCKPASDGSGSIVVYVTWDKVATAKGYVIEYDTMKEAFDNGSPGTSVEVKDGKTTSYNLTGLEIGHTYYFRVRAVRDNETSDPSPLTSLDVGTAPTMPTTWSSSNSAFEGDLMELNWTHNSSDGSPQTYAWLKFKIGDGTAKEYVFRNVTVETDTDEKTAPSSPAFPYGQVISYKGRIYVKIDTAHADLRDKTIVWNVATVGIHGVDGSYDTSNLSDYSTDRKFYIYSKPKLALAVVKDLADIDDSTSIITNLESFPLYIHAGVELESYEIQKPIGYYLKVISNDYYETADDTGRTKVVNIGDDVYSQYFNVDANTGYDLNVELSANSIDLESGIRYTIICSVDMSTGLSVQQTHDITPVWSDGIYTVTDTILDPLNGELIENAKTTDNRDVYIHIPDDGGAETYFCIDSSDVEAVYYLVQFTTHEYPIDATINIDTASYSATITPYCENANGDLIENVTLSVYRREYDGTYVTIAKDIPNNRTTVTDPHPALDYARYRLVSKDIHTGSMNFYDMAGYPVNGHAVIIQWNEDWVTYDVLDDNAVEGPPWSGSMLKLPYNIDVSDSRKREVELVKYAGRENPVSYYGTHREETSTWNVVIPSSDKETIYALRRLSLWAGDVYVREPSGMGYWANVNVSFNLKHNTVTIPVTINVTRVEGGT